MKHFIKAAAYLFSAHLLFFAAGCSKHDPPVPRVHVSTLTAGFASPNGIAYKDGNIWLSDQGTGKNDGVIWMIKPNGDKYKAIVHLESVFIPEGLEGPTHMLFSEGKLYILGALGKMYIAKPSNYKAGGNPIEASMLDVEDISDFVLNYPFQRNTHMCHPYGITKAPDGGFYITDAAANALLHRSREGKYSVVAEIPGVTNPLPVGPPVTESVPTGVIVKDGQLLVTTLLGFPFPPEKAVIYKITSKGGISVYQSGFTSLVDIIDGNNKGQLVLEHGKFNMGFTQKTGRLLWVDGKETKTVVDGLNLPAGVVQGHGNTWYVSSLGDKSIMKITYK